MFVPASNQSRIGHPLLLALVCQLSSCLGRTAKTVEHKANLLTEMRKQGYDELDNVEAVKRIMEISSLENQKDPSENELSGHQTLLHTLPQSDTSGNLSSSTTTT